MTKKEDLQRELKEKVKAGVKPSQLKRSKSADSLPTNNHANCQQQLKQAQLQIQQLTEQITRIKEATNQQLSSLPQLREELKEKEEKISELSQELDKSLESRLKNLKQPLTLEQTNQLQTELKQAKSKIALLERTLRWPNNSWLDRETWILVASFLITGLIFYYSTKRPHD